ncbi:DUF779 domain-containing protein [Cellulophaga sp. HaHaR_3_176]|uniref:DUF779 domain-containing protein n=1 Tax=Cellulophaga sp. HaHaR_3_176 TaxID=1942464 RepID=UPI001C1F7E8B|nr:DUF779 domain-containing protein [Cellulophaga sp. HaHaR_3_176]QWX82864.1 DUF779 domain-containing protein [Cellulophaga sp. HaHaR_3_176]
MNVKRILITKDAEIILNTLKEKYGDLMFHQSGGCCDGSSPMCFEKGEFMLNENDVWLDITSDCDFYMSKDQYEYWKHTQLTIDTVVGRGASFSLEVPLGVRFITKSRLFTEEESNNLEPIKYATTY